MTREQAVKWVKFVHDVLYEDKDEEIREALRMAIETLSEETPTNQEKHQLSLETPTDLIRRRDAIKALCTGECGITAERCEELTLGRHCNVYNALSALPSAEAIHKPDYSYEADMVRRLKESLPSADAVHGEWIEVEVFLEVYDIEGVKTWGSEMQCDQCGFRHTAIEGHMAQYNYCPNCGARMEVRKNDKR